LYINRVNTLKNADYFKIIAYLCSQAAKLRTLVSDIRKARKEYAKGETISCATAKELKKYFDSL